LFFGFLLSFCGVFEAIALLNVPNSSILWEARDFRFRFSTLLAFFLLRLLDT